MKAIKIIAKVAGVLVALLVVALLALPLWIGPVVTGVANAVAPSKTGTPFHLGLFGLNPYTGHLAVGDLAVSNPEGYKEQMALTLGGLTVDVEVGSVFGDTIVIREIIVRDLFASYVKDDRGVNNVDAILANVQGEKKSEKPAETKGAEKPAEKSVEKPAEKPAETKAAKKVIIDHIRLEGLKFKVGVMPIPVPTIDITGIGRKSQGVNWEEAWNEITAAVLAKLNAAGVMLKDLGVNLKDFGVDTGKLAAQLGADGAKKVGAAADAVTAVTKNAADALKVDKATDAVKGAADALKVDKATDAVKGAGEALKGLFK